MVYAITKRTMSSNKRSFYEDLDEFSHDPKRIKAFAEKHVGAGLLYSELPVDVRCDREMTLSLLRSGHCDRNFIGSVPMELLDDPSFCLVILDVAKEKALLWDGIPKKHYSDETFMRKAVEIAGATMVFEHCPESVRGDREFVKCHVAHVGRPFKYATLDVRADKDFVLDLLECDAVRFSLEYLDPSLREDHDIVTRFLALDGCNIKHTPLKSDYEYAAAAVTKNPSAFRYLGDAMRCNPKLLIRACQGYDKNLYTTPRHQQLLAEMVPVQMWNDPEYCEVLKKAGHVHLLSKYSVIPAFSTALKCRTADDRDNKALVMELVRLCPSELAFASDRLRDDPDVVMAALESGYNIGVLGFISDRLRSDKAIFEHAASIVPEALVYGSEKIRSDKDLITRFIGSFMDKDKAACLTPDQDPNYRIASTITKVIRGDPESREVVDLAKSII